MKFMIAWPDSVERTLIVVKPDGFTEAELAAGAAEQHVLNTRMVLQKALDVGSFVALKRGVAPSERWAEFYGEHRGKPYFEPLIAFMASGSVTVAALEGRDVVLRWRQVLGATDSRRALPGTIRNLLGDVTGNAIWKNVAHGSNSPAAAERELRFWFSEEELAGHEIRPGSVVIQRMEVTGGVGISVG